MAAGAPVPLSKLPQFLSSHPFWAKTHQAFVKAHPVSVAKGKGLLAARQRAQGNDPARFTAPMGQTQATQLADTMAGAQFDPAIGQVRQTEKNLSPWFADYQRQLADLTARSNAANAQTSAAVQGFQRTAGALDTGQTQRDTQGAQADAATRGATVDPSLAANSALAAAARSASVGQVGAGLATQGQNQSDYLSRAQGIAGGDLIQKRTALGAKEGSLLQQRGAEKEKQIGALRENERRYLLEQAAFQVNAQNAQTKAAGTQAAAQHQARTDQLAAQRLNLDKLNVGLKMNQAGFNQWLQKQKLSQGDRKIAIAYYNAHKPSAGRGSKPTKPTGLALGGRQQIVDQASQLKSFAPKVPGGAPGLKRYYDKNWSNINSVVRQAAWEGYVYHRINPNTANVLRSLGVSIPARWTQPSGFPI